MSSPLQLVQIWSGIVSTEYVNPYKVDKDNDGTAIYIALVASACGFVIFITIFVLCCKRFRICVNKKKLRIKCFYEQVNIPAAANGTDGTSISHNYSSLCMRDVQLSSENRRLCGSHDVPLSIISREIVNEKEINGQSDQYANLVFLETCIIIFQIFSCMTRCKYT
ncbi:unnamed protein product [Mytilus edulis]|uniref:Uncharacterized protein n=1 Tax=Mytilus edulis TaxID=6550 RepID=A0A8S3RQS3_MYTED|nr:unnamed protein product [Mytilus edulis]